MKQGLWVPRGIAKGWAGRRDTFYTGKLRGDNDPKEGFHPGNCQSKKERRMLEFLMPILNPDKPKRISHTMANTLFGAMSGSRPVNWGLLIHEVMAKVLPNIGKKPSFLSPFIFHLYQQYDLLLLDEEDELTIAADEKTYKLQSEAGETETPSDPIVSDVPPSTPGSPQPLPRPISPPPPPCYPPSPPPTHHPEAGPNGEATWRNVDPSARDFSDNPFWRGQEGLEELQHQYKRLEHIARGANQALDNCGPENIIREIAKRADRRELD